MRTAVARFVSLSLSFTCFCWLARELFDPRDERLVLAAFAVTFLSLLATYAAWEDA